MKDTARGGLVTVAAIATALFVWACDDGKRFGEDTGIDTAGDSAVDSSGDIPADNPGDGEDTAADPAGDTPADSVEDAPPDGPLTDADGDTISDWHEGPGSVDTDGDATPDSADLDSDGDTVPDAVEAGDALLDTTPEDCDGDGTPSFRDLDSDGDGLSDSAETAHGTGRCDPDSDDDGATDLAEIAYGSDPLDPEVNPATYGDFVFLVPHGGAPDPASDTLVFSTDLKVADVYFLIDRTCSMLDDIDALLEGIDTVVIPGIRAEIADAWFGVGIFQDCGGFGCAIEMANLQGMTENATLVENALASIAGDCCGGYEPYPHALYAVATGDVASFSSWHVTPTSWTCPAGAFGWPCFRPQAVPIIVQLGDEPFTDSISYCTPSISKASAIAALNGIEAKYIGVNSAAPPNSVADMNEIALGTGSVDLTGTPLVFDVTGAVSTLGLQVVDAVSQVATAVPIRVDAIASDDTSDMVDAVASFVSSIHTNTSGLPIWDPILGEMRVCSSGIPVGTPGTPPTADYFEIVQPGQSVCFDIVPRPNTTIPATTIPLVFRAHIDVIGDMHTPLDSREVFFVVPPAL